MHTGVHLFRLASICLLSATLSLSACGGDSAPPTTPTPPPPTGPATLQITDLVVGTGQEAAAPLSVTTHYTVWLYDPAGADSKGRRVQSSTDSGNPFAFRLGTNAVIPGFEQGVIGMRAGRQASPHRPSEPRLWERGRRQHPGKLVARVRNRFTECVLSEGRHDGLDAGLKACTTTRCLIGGRRAPAPRAARPSVSRSR